MSEIEVVAIFFFSIFSLILLRKLSFLSSINVHFLVLKVVSWVLLGISSWQSSAKIAEHSTGYGWTAGTAHYVGFREFILKNYILFKIDPDIFQ